MPILISPASVCVCVCVCVFVCSSRSCVLFSQIITLMKKKKITNYHCESTGVLSLGVSAYYRQEKVGGSVSSLRTDPRLTLKCIY